MDIITAEDLLSWASMGVKPCQMRIYRVANGENTLRLNNLDYFCWCKEDFLRYRQMIEDQHSNKQLAM